MCRKSQKTKFSREEITVNNPKNPKIQYKELNVFLEVNLQQTTVSTFFLSLERSKVAIKVLQIVRRKKTSKTIVRK